VPRGLAGGPQRLHPDRGRDGPQAAAEVQADVGPRLLARYQAIFDKLYPEDRDLTLRRGFFGFVWSLVGTAAFYGIYAFIVLAAVAKRITLGEMTMFILVFKQGQSAVAAILIQPLLLRSPGASGCACPHTPNLRHPP
jgi:hypothetical protein